MMNEQLPADGTAAQGVYRLDAHGRIAFADQEAARVLGYAPDELIGRHFVELFFAEDVPAAQRTFKQRRLGIGAVNDYSLRRKDGSPATVAVASAPTLDGEGVFLGITGFITDIDARRRRETLSTHERRLLRQIAGNYPLASVLEDLCLTLEAASRRPLRATVMLASGDSLSCIAAPSLPPEFRNSRIATALEGSGTACAEAVRSGRRVVVGDAARPDVSPDIAACRASYGFGAIWSYPIEQDAEILGTLALLLPTAGEPDAEDERAIEFGIQVARLALARERDARSRYELEQRLRDFAELSADWFWEQDADYRFTEISGGAFNKGGFRIADSLDKTRWELPIEGIDAAQWAAHRALLERHEVFRDFTYSIRVADGTRHWYSVSGKPVFGPDGEFLGYRGIGSDITDQWRAENQVRELAATLETRVKARTAELEESNRELDAFNFSVAHDLRTPLRAIEGFSQALLEDYYAGLDASGRDYLQRIGAATARMGELIEALHELSRLLRAPLILRPVDLSAMARELVAELRAHEPARAVEFEIEEMPPAEGDPRLLRIVLANLLGNAWKFTARTAPARIAFGARTDQHGRIEYCVRDNGAGFDMQFADKLFLMFHRLHREHEFPGQGIGLTTVQRILARHGGSIRGDGQRGAGASFCFTLWNDPALLVEARATVDPA